jgi:hypothetical protein
MSWLAQNYEKAAIGGAAVAALGLAFLGWSKVGAVEEDFTIETAGSSNRNPEIVDADRVPQAKSQLEVNRVMGQGDASGRLVDLFTGVPLFVDRDTPDVGIDLLTSAPVHPPIPNQWWIDNEIDPGFADSPARDPDGDGFSNLEEFEAGTDPNNPDAFPSLVAKLRYARDESVDWVLRPGSDDGAGGFAFQYGDSAGVKNRVGVGNVIKPGELFFREGPLQGRFKLLGSEVRKEVNPRNNLEVERIWVRVEDQRANKKGTIYEIQASFPEDRADDFTHHDRSAVFTLEALGAEGTEFVVEENTTFSLPYGGADADHKLLEVTPAAVKVEHPTSEGGRAVLEIPKGR